VDGEIVSRKRLACFPLQQMYLIALAAGLQRLEKNHEGETLVVPGFEWAIRKKKEGQIKSLPLFEVRHEGLLRRFTQERLLQFSPKLRFRLLAIMFFLALEDLSGRRKLFSHPCQSLGNSSGFYLRHGAQWSVLSSKPSLSTTVPPWRNIISSP
jgi:hypothetical protein